MPGNYEVVSQVGGGSSRRAHQPYRQHPRTPTSGRTYAVDKVTASLLNPELNFLRCGTTSLDLVQGLIGLVPRERCHNKLWYLSGAALIAEMRRVHRQHAPDWLRRTYEKGHQHGPKLLPFN